MKQVVAEAGEVKVIETPAPACGETEVLVKSEFSVISAGTESWTIGATEPVSARDLMADQSKLGKTASLVKGVWEHEGLSGVVDYVKAVRRPRVSLGYSLSGVVLEVGRQVRDVVVGDRVACAGEGKAIHAEFAAVPRNLMVKVPAVVSMRDAAFSTLGAIAIHGFRQSGAQLGEWVCIVGAGLVGSLVLEVARAAGCKTIAVDVREDRLALARRIGANYTLASTDPLLGEHISSLTHGMGVDHVIVCAAADTSDAVNLASSLLRDRGNVTILGRVGMNLEREFYYKKELEVMMSRSLGPGRYDPTYEERGVDYPLGYVRWTLGRNMDAFLQLLAEGRISVEPLIDGIFGIEDAPRAYESLKRAKGVANLLQYEQGPRSPFESRVVAVEDHAATGRVGVALIGPGNYAKEILIPALRRSGAFDLTWVVSSNPLRARQVAERFHFASCTTDSSAPLKDDSVRLVVIATPNNLHHDMVVAAARRKKAVFVEKPLCITKEELEDIVKVQAETKARIVVGFNRRYAPLFAEMKRKLSMLDGPFLMNYRINADYIPNARWVQDPLVGGGRIIAECCHFVDFFNCLVGSRDPEVEVFTAGVTGSTTVTRDNLAMILRYPDGSLGNIVYSALGNRTMERERVEVFCQKTGMVLDDFRHLTVYKAGEVKRYGTGRTDKGHAAELTELSKLIEGKPNNVISFEDAVSVTRTTFEIEKKLRSGVPAGS